MHLKVETLIHWTRLRPVKRWWNWLHNNLSDLQCSPMHAYFESIPQCCIESQPNLVLSLFNQNEIPLCSLGLTVWWAFIRLQCLAAILGILPCIHPIELCGAYFWIHVHGIELHVWDTIAHISSYWGNRLPNSYFHSQLFVRIFACYVTLFLK